MPNPAIRAFASLGSDTQYGGNIERDLHRWLRGLYNFKLQSYTIYLMLQVSLDILMGKKESFSKCVFG